MTKWHAHVAHMAKHMNMVGGPLWWWALGPGPLVHPKPGAAERRTPVAYAENFRKGLHSVAYGGHVH